jgi:hypothetical protein
LEPDWIVGEELRHPEATRNRINSEVCSPVINGTL